MNSLNILWLLLPVAAASGWFLARRTQGNHDESEVRNGLRSDYFKGIHYLLNEQPDRAIDVFIKVLEVDSETVETHLALGNLYRRRGEVDRAIRIHQNLVARQSLDHEQRAEAVLELGQDYLSAGLLDRAENLFRELAESNSYEVQALRQLIDIYEQEKDWENAIRCSGELQRVTGNQLGGIIAHYYCEQAERLRGEGELEAALEMVEGALGTDASCVRASLMEGDIRAERRDYEGAISALRRIEKQEPAYLPETVHRLESCFEALGRSPEMEQHLAYLMERYGGITTTLALAERKREEGGAREAIRFIADQLQRRTSVRGLDRLLQLELAEADGDAAEHLQILKDVTGELIEERPVYQCRHCGFPARLLHWQCPSCKHWNTIKPIQGVEGE